MAVNLASPKDLESILLQRFYSFVAKYEKKLGRSPLLEIAKIILINEGNQTYNLSTLDFFDSTIEGNCLYLTNQNPKYMEIFLEFAAIKCFFSSDHIKASHFMQMVYLIWVAPVPSKIKLKNYFSEIINIVNDIYFDIYKMKNPHLERELIIFCEETDFSTIYKEFLIGQPPHNQTSLYFVAFQTYLLPKTLLIQNIDFDKLIIDSKTYIDKFKSSPFLCTGPSLFRMANFIPFYIDFGRLGLQRIEVTIQCSSEIASKILAFLNTIPNILIKPFNYSLLDGSYYFILLSQESFKIQLAKIFDNMKSSNLVFKYKILPITSLIAQLKTHRFEVLYAQSATPEMDFIDFYLLDSIYNVFASDENDATVFGNQLLNNTQTFFLNQKRKIRHILKSNAKSPIDFTTTLNTLMEYEKNPTLRNKLLERFMFLKMNGTLSMNSINLVSNILLHNQSYIPMLFIGGSGISEKDFSFSDLNSYLVDNDNNNIETRLHLDKKNLFSHYYHIYRLNLDIITIHATQKEPFSNHLLQYDFSSKKWIDPQLSPDQINGMELNQNRRVGKYLASMPSYKVPNKMQSESKIRFFDYTIPLEMKFSQRYHFCEFVKNFFIFEDPLISDDLNPEISKKIKLNSTRGDQLQRIPNKERRYWLKIIGIQINISPVLNPQFFTDIFLSQKAIHSINFQGGSFNGFLIIDFANHDDVNHKLLKDFTDSQCIEYEIIEITEEYRWFNAAFYLNEDFLIRTYSYLSKYSSLTNYPPMVLDSCTKKYFKEFPLLYYVAGFNLCFLYAFECPKNYTFEDILKIFSIFSMGKILKTSSSTIFLVLYLDYGLDIITKINQFFINHNIEYRCHQMHNLLEIDRKHSFFTTQ